MWPHRGDGRARMKYHAIAMRTAMLRAGYMMLPHFFNSSQCIWNTLVQATSYWHNQRKARAGFCTLETTDRGLKDQVHLSMEAI